MRVAAALTCETHVRRGPRCAAIAATRLWVTAGVCVLCLPVAGAVPGALADASGTTLRIIQGKEARGAGLGFVPASPPLLARCRSTARTVGYPVPCPTRVPRDIEETGGQGLTRCSLHIIGPGGVGGCAKEWRGWVVGSSSSEHGHLVLTASPRPLRDDAKVVNGPAWYPGAQVQLVRRLRISGWRMRAVLVPSSTNAGSAFAEHVVLIWTVGRHTYGVGFHDVKGLRRTLLLDETLARGIRMVQP